MVLPPELPGGPPDMFFCGNDDAAGEVVAGILTDFGWPSIDIGSIEGARLLEPMCILWVICGLRTGTWGHAFKLLRQ
jgi:predicted dinucleotide-binding enzyme